MSSPWPNFNYPINVYPAGSYRYSMTASASGASGRAADQVTVNYPVDLGTSVSVNFKGSGDTSSPSTTVNLQSSGVLT